MASCNPPAGNDGECQQTCHLVTIPNSAFNAGPNQLQIKLTNLFNVPLGNGNFGWTGLSYALCAQPVSLTGSPTPIASVIPSQGTATPSWTATATPTSTPVLNQPTATFSPTPERTCDPVPYPNPCRGGDRLHFRVGGGPYDGIYMKVYTTGYRLVHRQDHPCGGREEEDLDWDLRDDSVNLVSNGLYYAVIETHGKGVTHRYTEKVMILR